ncbi:hypothetical protein HUU61_13270 [Rhodopseudomonas palustris]|nr:hypothetical protein [Rhodopseudomonas palustris]
MSTIGGTNMSANGAVASLIQGAGWSSAATASAGGASSPSGPSAASSAPTDIVDLSNRAKQILARARSEQLAADKLTDLLLSLHSSERNKTTQQVKANDGSSLFDQLSSTTKAQPPNTTQWEAGSKYGDPTISDADFLAQIKPALMNSAQGLPPEQRQALESAINNGTLNIQKASDVAGLNYRSTVSYTGTPGGLQGMSVNHQSNPTGDAKDALDQGRAYAFWTADRGDVYVSW